MYYFVYSQKQFDNQTAAYKKTGKTYLAGKVGTGGQAKAYTSITQDIDLTRKLFGDSIVVAQTESLNKINYTKPKANAIRRTL
jgi:hypothetical protein